ncbi:DsbA family protein [Bowmanella sp. Y26]|uniref:DsbA family oxidoreductase n=1 Tax=Bowmanella yangjiangensis TaxID=2811230 RepID=UPI001BDCDC47|nr:DsbA family protein [Bowmanella yangjiangensis]MBT1062708.1 DsbA family protein [Bowmanella yangjiangensis]
MQVEFFHDAVCGWCYLQSPRLRKVAQNLNIKIVHRAFVLQRNEQEMIARFGSMQSAKDEILRHWQACQQHAEQPERFNIEGMRAKPFNYPSGYQAALAAKSAEILAGQAGHWQLFDAIQTAHLKENRNIADTDTLLDIATEQGFERAEIARLMSSEPIIHAVESDNLRARQIGVRSIPSLYINNQRLISQTLTQGEMYTLFHNLNKLEGALV